MRDPRIGRAGRGGGEARARAPPKRSRLRLAQGPPGSARRRRRRARLPRGVLTAWRRCLESWAEARETILVFEDLHWADEALLTLLEHLADWSQGVPLLFLCTARPELYEQHPSWAAGLRNATTINLAPLTDEETSPLIATLLERAVLPAETQQALLERAGGNPLYAEEFVRLLSDRGAPGDVTEMPDSVQALIAARLDTLTPERKSLLQDAAVLGKVFWAGALAEMGAREPREVETALHELSRKELVRPARTSRWRERPSTASGTCWSETSATPRFPGPPARRATTRPPPGSSARPASG